MSRAAWWFFWTGASAVGLTACAAVAGIASWYFGLQVTRENEARTQGMELRIAEQQERAAKAESALLELQERARPRTIDATARAAIIDMLRSSRPDGPIEMQFLGGSVKEPHDFARMIADVLKEAGWNVDRFSGGAISGSAFNGLVILVPEEGEAPTRAVVLQAALKAGGFPAILAKSRLVTQGEVMLRVGLKP
jgi:hypothetical protein